MAKDVLLKKVKKTTQCIAERCLQELNFLKRSNLKSCYALFGVFRRGNKPSVLPRDRKTSGATIERASLMRAERLKNKKNLVYNSSGLATALLEYRRFFK